MAETGRKKCFVVAPIGNRGSDTFLRTEDVQDYIIAPSIEQCGYEMPPIRADQISEPGRITKQIIDHLINDALVVADLTDRNPNVFYELAIRHAVRKPIVQIIHKSQTIPFDVGIQRTIFYDHQNLRDVPRTIEEIVAQIKAAEHDPDNVDTPLSDAIFQQSLSDSTDPIQKSNAEILEMLREIQFNTSILRNVSSSTTFSGTDYDTLSAQDDEHPEYEDNILLVENQPEVGEGYSKNALPIFVAGDRVKHKVFGVGTIVRVEGKSDVIQAAFPAPVGLKRLDVRYAKLTRV